MAVGTLGTGHDADSANSISFSYTSHSGTNRKLLAAVVLRATSPVISGASFDGASMNLSFSYVNGIVRTSFFYLDDVDFPSTPGTYTFATTTTGTDPRMAVFVIEVEDAIQGSSFAANANGSSDGSPVDVTVTPSTDGGLVFCWSGRVGASAIDTAMDGTETYIPSDDYYVFDFSAFEAAYTEDAYAVPCSCIADISSANDIVAGSVAIGTTVDPFSADTQFFGAGF